MNEYYKQPVVILGVALPLLGLVLILAVSAGYRSKLEKTYEFRKGEHVKLQTLTKQRERLEEQIGRQQPYMSRWMSLFDKPADSAITSLLNDVQTQYASTELDLTSFNRSSASGGIGGASKQSAVQLKLAFRGTYRGLQNAFLEVETRMPHLQLDLLKLKKESNQNMLNADLTYTAWQNE